MLSEYVWIDSATISVYFSYVFYFFYFIFIFFIFYFFFFFNDTATTEIYTLSLHDALPISNDLYNQQFSNWLLRIKNNPRYKRLSNEDKQKLLTKKKIRIKNDIFKKYRFKYKRTKKKSYNMLLK